MTFATGAVVFNPTIIVVGEGSFLVVQDGDGLFKNYRVKFSS